MWSQSPGFRIKHNYLITNVLHVFGYYTLGMLISVNDSLCNCGSYEPRDMKFECSPNCSGIIYVIPKFYLIKNRKGRRWWSAFICEVHGYLLCIVDNSYILMPVEILQWGICFFPSPTGAFSLTILSSYGYKHLF